MTTIPSYYATCNLWEMHRLRPRVPRAVSRISSSIQERERNSRQMNWFHKYDMSTTMKYGRYDQTRSCTWNSCNLKHQARELLVCLSLATNTRRLNWLENNTYIPKTCKTPFPYVTRGLGISTSRSLRAWLMKIQEREPSSIRLRNLSEPVERWGPIIFPNWFHR